MLFHPEAARHALQPLDPAQPVPSGGPVADYCCYYHLDFEHDFPGLHHACGYVELAQYQILTHVFIPPDARGTVWVVHGYLEHSGLYRHLLPQLIGEGYAVVIHDLPGHGLSTGIRASIHDFEEYQTIFTGLMALLDTHAPRPWLGVGQSTGGAILMDHVLSKAAGGEQPALDRLLLLAPLVLPTRLQWWQMKLAFWWFQATRTGLPRAFRPNTSDHDFVRFMREEDPLQARWIPLSWLLALRDWITRVHRLPACSLPVWLVQGKLDGTVNSRAGLRFVQRNFRLVTALMLPEASHQLVNERADIRTPIDALVKRFLAGQP